MLDLLKLTAVCACRSAPDSGAVNVAIIGTGVATAGEEAIIPDTEFTESATVSVDGRARQTDRKIAGPIWASSLDCVGTIVPDCSSSE